MEGNGEGEEKELEMKEYERNERKRKKPNMMKMKEKMWHQRKSVGPVQPLGLPDLHGERLSIPRQQAAVAPEKREPCGRLCAIQNQPKSFCQQQLEPIQQTISGNNSGEKNWENKKNTPPHHPPSTSFAPENDKFSPINCF